MTLMIHVEVRRRFNFIGSNQNRRYELHSKCSLSIHYPKIPTKREFQPNERKCKELRTVFVLIGVRHNPSLF